MTVSRPINASICIACQTVRAVVQSRRSLSAPRLLSTRSMLQNPPPNPPSSFGGHNPGSPNGSLQSSPPSRPHRTSGLGDRGKFSEIIQSMHDPADASALLSPVAQPKPYKFNVMFTKRNTHMTLSAPPPPAVPGQSTPQTHSVLLSFSTGSIGFRKAGRGSFDAAFQLAGFTFKKIQEGAMLRGDSMVEVIFRGTGPGREAVTKAILGTEGRLLRPKVCAVIDATRLKIGGSRSPRPRRLG